MLSMSTLKLYPTVIAVPLANILTQMMKHTAHQPVITGGFILDGYSFKFNINCSLF